MKKHDNITMKKYVSLVFIFFILTIIWVPALPAGPLQDKFKVLEEKENNANPDPALRQTQLKSTLTKSMRIGLVSYFSYAKYADVTSKDITYEMVVNDKFAYYVKYKQFIGYFIYSQDPALYYVSPFKQKFLTESNDYKKIEYVVQDWSEN